MEFNNYEIISDYFDLIEKGYERGEPITDAPSEYHLFSFLTIVGALLDKNVYLYFSSKKIYPNLWTVLVGKSSLFRKSTSIGLATRILEDIQPGKLLPSEFSLEKLFEILSASPTGLFWLDEFSSFFQQFHRSYMTGGTSFFLQLYESDLTIKRYLMGGEYEIENPCISIISATTLEGISTSLKEREIRTGLLPRFNFVVVKKKQKNIMFPDTLSLKKLNALEEKLKSIVEFYSTPYKVSITNDAIKKFEQFSGELLSNKEFTELDPDLPAFVTRILTSILKISIILACLEKRREVIEKDIEFATICGKVFIKSAELVLGQLCWNKSQEHRKKVLEVLESFTESGIQWVSRTDLIRKTRLFSSELNRVINTLLDEDLIEFQQMKAPNEKRVTVYYKLKTEN